MGFLSHLLFVRLTSLDRSYKDLHLSPRRCFPPVSRFRPPCTCGLKRGRERLYNQKLDAIALSSYPSIFPIFHPYWVMLWNSLDSVTQLFYNPHSVNKWHREFILVSL